MTHDANFKLAARRFASGVTVVGTRVEGGVYGVTVSSFASLSVDPLLVTVSINRHSPLIEMVRTSGIFAISVLTSEQQEVSQYFATRDRGLLPDWLPTAPTVAITTGAPVVSGCLSYFDCRLHSLLEGGDHMIFVGQVVSAGGTDGEPLLYFDGGYRSLSPEQRSAQRSAETVEVGLSLLDLRPDELFDTQRAVEPVLAGLASERATASDLGRLESLLTEADACLDDPDRTTELGMDFHVALADIAGNRPLRATMSAVSHLERALLPEHTDPHRARKVLEIHRTIFEHVRDGRPELASRTMAEHVDEMNARLPG